MSEIEITDHADSASISIFCLFVFSGIDFIF